MATTTPVADCPVPWCPESGRHAYDTLPSGERYRFHRVDRRIEIASGQTGRPVVVTVAAEVMDELADGVEQTPDLDRTVWVSLSSLADDILLMRNRDEIDDVVFALQDAADLVFPEPPVEPCVSPEDEAEFEAALDEVVERAEHPIDLDRLVSATIRLRRAYLGCAR